MFSLGDGTKFWLYTKPTDMRKNFNMLSGIVNNDMRQNLYIFRSMFGQLEMLK